MAEQSSLTIPKAVQRNAAQSRPATQGAATDLGELTEVALDLLDDSPDQPRSAFNPEYIEQLADNIAARGLIQTPTIRRVGDRYQIIAGHCRRAAFQINRERGAPGRDWSRMPARLIAVSDVEAAFMSLSENIEREDLSPAEEGAAYTNLMHKYGLAHANELAERLRIDEQRVARRLRIHEGPEFIKVALTRGLKVPLLESELGEGRKRHETRKLTLEAALEFLKLFDHYLKKYPGLEGGRRDGRPIAEIKTEAVVTRALSEGWSREKLRTNIERLRAGKQLRDNHMQNELMSTAVLERKRDQLVIHCALAQALSVEQQGVLLEDVRRALFGDATRAG